MIFIFIIAAVAVALAGSYTCGYAAGLNDSGYEEFKEFLKELDRE